VNDQIRSGATCHSPPYLPWNTSALCETTARSRVNSPLVRHQRGVLGRMQPAPTNPLMLSRANAFSGSRRRISHSSRSPTPPPTPVDAEDAGI
jgi:hypothetical protein